MEGFVMPTLAVRLLGELWEWSATPEMAMEMTI